MSRNEIAARAISREPDAAVLLEMLGLTVDGVLQPDDDRVWDVAVAGPVGGRSESRLTDTTFDARPKVSTAPAALRELPPLQLAPVVRSAGRTKSEIARAANAHLEKPCPSKGARERHRRRGEKCQVCIDDVIARSKRRPRPKCGDKGGLMAHRYRGEEVCTPCREAYNAHKRATDAARRAAKKVPA